MPPSATSAIMLLGSGTAEIEIRNTGLADALAKLMVVPSAVLVPFKLSKPPCKAIGSVVSVVLTGRATGHRKCRP